MITTTLDAIINANTALSKLVNEKIPATLAFRLAGIIKECEIHYNTYESAKTSLQNKYGLKDEAGNLKTIAINETTQSVDFGDNLEHLTKEHDELLKEEVTITKESISIDSLCDLKIESATLLQLMWMLKE